ncbi:MAG: ABC transporter permease [Bacteroidetes bacterium]|nr:ABC transporter permease [Bacteroidota bacterium]
MWRHHFLLAIRTLWRNKFHTAINVAGLSIGVGACLVIYLIVSFELSYNKEIPGYDRIYRVHSKFNGNFVGLNRGAPTAVAPYLAEHFKGVENAALFFTYSADVQIPSASVKKFQNEERIAIADENYFRIFEMYSWIWGSEATLAKPHQVVLTQRQAIKYFGTDQAEQLQGKQIIYHDSLTVYVAGVVREPAIRTDFEFTQFISMPTVKATWLKNNFQLDDWESTNSSSQVFVKVTPETLLKQLQDQLPEISKIYNAKNNFAKNDFNVQPLRDLHFDVETGIFDFSRDAAHLPTLLALIGVAIMLLVIGAINFINLETAQAMRRAKEVGVRKVLGSSRSRLVIQFLCESLLLTLVAIALALPLAELGLTYFSEFIPEGVKVSITALAPFLLFVIFFIGILASSYPAFFLSSFLPVMALKNQAAIYSSQPQISLLRKSLIIFQFTFAQVLIIGTLMVGRQIQYMLSKDLGFRKEAVIYFHTPWWQDKSKMAQLKTKLESLPEIKEISLSTSPPSANGWSSSSAEYDNGKEKFRVNAFRKFGDVNYLKFYGIELLAGRNVMRSDTLRELIINETMRKQLGFQSPEAAIDAMISFGGRKYPVVGVVKDFHIQSLRQKLEPVVLADQEENFSCFNLRLEGTNQSGEALKSSLAKIESQWKSVYPDDAFSYQFLDDTIKNFYKAEQRMIKLSGTAMGLAIFISCLGLFGLASYSATQRTKEIGVRKVLGASVQQIVMLLSRDFLILVVVAFVLASPMAWFGINQWLAGFSYHTEFSLWIFAGAMVSAVVIAFVTISFQTIKAATSNPVDSLRSE